MIIASSASSAKRARHFRQRVPLTLTETPFESAPVLGVGVSSSGSCVMLEEREEMRKVADTDVMSETDKEIRGCQGLIDCHLDGRWARSRSTSGLTSRPTRASAI